MARLDGGHAFPTIIDHPEKFVSIDGSPLTNYQAQRLEHVSGMSIMDYMAAAAMQGLITDPDLVMTHEQIAAWSYTQALAMIEQKERLND